jgi:hypothetical protein
MIGFRNIMDSFPVRELVLAPTATTFFSW